ncbi:hypothetical protein GUJ93_ZPchr0002g26372 [Zizania palustris]|uniref:RING-type domain-containing protein n=1 Tax=Zizania palustris TaxID=103762 RepID=A0A8J5RUM8_ZIZPA|nr:hypothetical protein GUJ93_ZPchr0002g26372 [Zizania palustris]
MDSWFDEPDTFEDFIADLQDSDDGFDADDDWLSYGYFDGDVGDNDDEELCVYGFSSVDHSSLSSCDNLENPATESLQDDPLPEDVAVSGRLEEEEQSEFLGYDGGGEGLMESWGDEPDTFGDLIADLQDSDYAFDADDDVEFFYGPFSGDDGDGDDEEFSVDHSVDSLDNRETESLVDDLLTRALAVSSGSFESDGDLGDALPQLVSAMRLSPGNVSEESEFLGYDGGGDEGSWSDHVDTYGDLIADLHDSDEGSDFASPILLMDTNDIDSDDFLSGVLTGHGGEAAAAFAGGITTRPFPASRIAVDSLPEATLSEEEASRGCAVCKDCFASGQLVASLPCKHFFHGDCIWPWLAISNTCPVCRRQLRVDDPDYQQRMARRVIVLVPLQHHHEAPAPQVSSFLTF